MHISRKADGLFVVYDHSFWHTYKGSIIWKNIFISKFYKWDLFISEDKPV